MNLESMDHMSIRQINKVFRDNDESHLWPISGKFNATERAIRRLRPFGLYGGIEYANCLDDEISRIVNDERNW